MATLDDLYPPTPDGIPAELTKPTLSYRLRVLLVLGCLFFFVLVYLCLTAGSAYLSYWCFEELLAPDQPTRVQPAPPSSGYGSPRRAQPAPRKDHNASPIWALAGGICSGLLCVFLLKGVFRITRGDPGVRLEVTEQDQPILFGFIRRLCQETGAPFPHQIFLVPDVNAAVAFHQSVLSLIFPTRKNLIIGLGLVNRLNLSEFKAVLAHEFGHFSQNSMRLGSYVYTANRVIVDVVYGRGKLDDFVAMLRRIDLRIAVFAWAFTAVLWTMRKGLELLFRGINFAHTALSRQMEYNADLVAVSVTGSDALVFALARLDLATDSLMQAWADLMTAADHNRFSRDLYFHQTRAVEYLRRRNNNPVLGEAPALPADPKQTVQVFKPEDVTVPRMWATHPTNHDREVNVKKRYCRSHLDERSAWELFSSPDGVREAMTRIIYATTSHTIPKELEAAEAVQEFIEAEHAETTYHPHYHGLYDDRYIRPGELSELLMRSTWMEFEDPAALKTAHAALHGEELNARMTAHKNRHEELGRLSRMSQGAVQLTGKDFEHRGQRFGLSHVPRLLKEVESEIEQDFQSMHVHDRQSFRLHYAMAVQLGEAERQELEERYRFHLAIQEMHTSLVAHSRHVNGMLASMSGRREVSQDQFQEAVAALRDAHNALSKNLANAAHLHLPALTNVTAGQPLTSLLRTEPLIRNLHHDIKTLDGQWIGTFMGQLQEVIQKLARVLFKSLGGLLALQERIAERWHAASLKEPEKPTPP